MCGADSNLLWNDSDWCCYHSYPGDSFEKTIRANGLPVMAAVFLIPMGAKNGKYVIKMVNFEFILK